MVVVVVVVRTCAVGRRCRQRRSSRLCRSDVWRSYMPQEQGKTWNASTGSSRYLGLSVAGRMSVFKLHAGQCSV